MKKDLYKVGFRQTGLRIDLYAGGDVSTRQGGSEPYAILCT